MTVLRCRSGRAPRHTCSETRAWARLRLRDPWPSLPPPRRRAVSYRGTWRAKTNAGGVGRLGGGSRSVALARAAVACRCLGAMSGRPVGPKWATGPLSGRGTATGSSLLGHRACVSFGRRWWKVSCICRPHSSQQPSLSVAPSSLGTSVSATTCVRRVSCTLGHSLKRTTTTGGPSPLGAGTTLTTVASCHSPG